MDNQALQQIKGIIDSNEQFSIVVGKHAKVDDLAAALGLYITFQTAGKKVSIASATELLVEHSSLVGIDKVESKLQGGAGGDFIVSFPYKDEGEIEKVSYTLESGMLNIIVKPGEQGLSFTQNDVKYTQGGSLSGLLITVGAPHLADVSSLYDAQNATNLTIINIDNKEQNDNFGQVVLVSPRFSSISEQVADLLLSLGYDFEVDAAQNLLIGITAATNNFQAAQTSYLAFEIAAILLRKGAKRVSPRSQQSNQPQRQNQQQHRDDTRQKQQFNQPRSEQRRPQNQQQQRQFAAPVHTPVENVKQQPLVQTQPAFQPTQVQAAPVQIQEDVNPPADWLTPKVYKGSSNI